MKNFREKKKLNQNLGIVQKINEETIENSSPFCQTVTPTVI